MANTSVKPTVFAVKEGTTTRTTGVLRDHLRNPIAAAQLQSMTGTLYDRLSDAIINSREAQNFLNANGCTIDASGNWAVVLVAADNAMKVATRANEVHVLLIEFSYKVAGDETVYTGKQEIWYVVQNLAHVS